MKASLVPGLTTTRRFTVEEEGTVDIIGREHRVYATPTLVRDIERTSRDFMRDHLDEGEDTVGVRIELDHLSATLLGMWIDITSTVREVDGRRVTLEVEANDALDRVAKATHVRFVVDKQRQVERLEAKAAKFKALG